jgi:integrase/recombinase XerC
MPPSAASDPGPARPEAKAFRRYLAKERNDSPHTVKAYMRDLAELEVFCDRYYGGAGRWDWRSVDRLALRSFMGELTRRGLAKRSVARALSVARSFYRFLGQRYGLEENPAKGLRLPRLERRLPQVLDRSQIDAMFQYAEALAENGGFGPVRDLTMLELFYSTGMRLSEVAGLDLRDVDVISQQAKVRGKGRKERLLPFGRHASAALRRYLPERRPAALAPGSAARNRPVSSHRRRGHGISRTHAAPQFRDPPARRRSGSTGRTGTARACVAQHHPGVYSYECREAQEGVPRRASAGVVLRSRTGNRGHDRRNEHAAAYE